MRLFRHSSITKIFIVFFLSIFTCSSIFLSALPTPSSAEVSIEKIKSYIGNLDQKGGPDYVKEFCDKRSGDLMNLETWFSGKCGEDVDSWSGEGVGFVDIIQLQGLEWFYSWFSRPHKTTIENIQDNINAFEEIKNKLDGLKSSADIKSILAFNTDEIRLKYGLSPNIFEKSLKTLLLTKPASSIDYYNYIASNLHKNHISSEVYAASAGYGFTSLSPILPLWRAFRNISYVLFALAFVIYGIMIMFRVRIDSKTAATIQLAIPKLVGTLILITFSYAIVGILIDLSTVLSALLIDVLRLGEIISDSNHPIILSVAGQLPVVGGFLSVLINGFVAFIITPFIVFNLIFGGVLGTIMALFQGIFGGIGILLGLVVILAVLWSYFKLVLSLFKCYINIIVYLIFSPIILLGNVLPGSKSFSSWIMNIIANLSAFPATSFLLVLSHAMMMQPIVNIIGGTDATWGGVKSFSYGLLSAASGGPSGFWTPPMTIPTSSFGDIMIATIGLGLLLMSSKYVDMIMDALKVPPFKYGTAIGDALKFGYNQVGDNKSTLRKNTWVNDRIGEAEEDYRAFSAGAFTHNDLVNGKNSDASNFVGPAKSK